jgi:hypothetical protein
LHNDGCADCPEGKFSDAYNVHRCSFCASGQFSIRQSASCSLCSLGTFRPSETHGDCQACEAGRFAAWVGTTNCFHCPNGKFQDKKAYHECHECGAGTWTMALSGLTACVPVPTPSPTPSPTPPTAAPTKSPTPPPTGAPTKAPTPIPVDPDAAIGDDDDVASSGTTAPVVDDAAAGIDAVLDDEWAPASGANETTGTSSPTAAGTATADDEWGPSATDDDGAAASTAHPTSAPTDAPSTIQDHVAFTAIWETPAHMCAGGVCAWSTCAEWTAKSCPLPCADVIIRTYVSVLAGATKTARTITVSSGGTLLIKRTAAVAVKRSTAGCCAHLGPNYVQDDANGRCAVSTGYPTPFPTKAPTTAGSRSDWGPDGAADETTTAAPTDDVWGPD